MKPDETPAPSEEKCRDWVTGAWRPHDWIVSYNGQYHRCRNCRKTEPIARTPVQPTESGAIGSKSVVEGQSGDKCNCADWGMMGHLPSCPEHENNKPSAGEVPTPKYTVVRDGRGISRVYRYGEHRGIANNCEAQLADDLAATKQQLAAMTDNRDVLVGQLQESRRQLAAEQAKVEAAKENAENAQILAREHLANSIRKNSVIADIESQRDAAIARAEKAEKELAEKTDLLVLTECDREKWKSAADAFGQQLSTLRKAVEEAPHGDCPANIVWTASKRRAWEPDKCDCWKSRALNAEGGI